MEISISLIIPVYNVEKYLERCLESVIQQTMPFDEIILVNDDSTDSSLEICEKYMDDYDRVKIISKKNEGLSIARNTGVKYATGDYVMFLDSDDWLRTDTVEVLKKQLIKTIPDVIYFDAEVIYEDGIEKGFRNQYDRSRARLDGRIMKGMEYFYKSYPLYYVASACLAVYRKDLIEKENILFPRGLYYEDNYFTFTFLGYAKKVLHISEKLYNRLYHENSIMTSAYSEKKFKDYIKVVLLIWDNIHASNRERELNQFMSEHLNTILLNYEKCLKSGVEIEAETYNLWKCVSNKYVEIMRINKFPNDFSVSELIAGVQVLKGLIKYGLVEENEIAGTLEQAKALQKISYTNILRELPLNNPNLKIGIYGTGNHTDGLLYAYEKLMGKVECELIFIDSKKDGGMYMNRTLINYKKVDNSFDRIIISSFLYNQDMLNNISKMHLQVPIHSFYNTVIVDIFSRVYLE